MDQPNVFVQARFEKLLKHYDINDFIEFLTEKKFLPTYELKFLPSGKQEIISYLLSQSGNLFESGLFDVFRQYTTFVSEDVALTLSQTPSARKQFSHNKDSDHSFSLTSFSDDPCQQSQESPTVSQAQDFTKLKLDL